MQLQSKQSNRKLQAASYTHPHPKYFTEFWYIIINFILTHMLTHESQK
jgi:hypothetical protein